RGHAGRLRDADRHRPAVRAAAGIGAPPPRRRDQPRRRRARPARGDDLLRRPLPRGRRRRHAGRTAVAMRGDRARGARDRRRAGTGRGAPDRRHRVPRLRRRRAAPVRACGRRDRGGGGVVVRGDRIVEAGQRHLPRRARGTRRRTGAGAPRGRHRGDRRGGRQSGRHRRAHRRSWRPRRRRGYDHRADRRARPAVTDSSRRDAATAAIHAGRLPALAGVPVIAPVHRSVIYEFVDADEFGRVMGDARQGYLYTRIRNPTTDELGAVVAELEGAEAGLCFASGMGALSAAVAELAPPGAGMVAATQIYGQTHHMAASRPDGRLVDIGDMDALRRAAEGAAVVVCETVSNPSLAVADIPAVAEVAHAAGARLVVDNTIATPIGCRPLDHGADLVFHSATKYLNGHSDVLAGVAAGPAELIGRLAERSLELGATLAPDSAWLVRRGVRTLHLRVERAAENAMAIAAFLEGHPRVRRV